MGKVCSDTVSNAFFDFAMENSDIFMQLKAMEGRLKMRTYRKCVIENPIPEIQMDYVLEDLALAAGNRPEARVEEFNCLAFPKKKYPADKYRLQFSLVRRQKHSQVDCLPFVWGSLTLLVSVY